MQLKMGSLVGIMKQISHVPDKGVIITVLVLSLEKVIIELLEAKGFSKIL